MKISRLDDPVVAAAGVHVRQPYVERFWLPILGPTATLLLRRLALELSMHQHAELVDEELAASLGVHMNVLAKTVARLERFDCVKTNGDIVVVRTVLPRLPQRLLVRLTDDMRTEHDEVADRMLQAGG